jgi:hypothetical protein
LCFLSGVTEVSALLGYDATLLGNHFLTFRENVLVSSLRVGSVGISKNQRGTFRILGFSVFEDEVSVFRKLVEPIIQWKGIIFQKYRYVNYQVEEIKLNRK